jgi:hypothetical protein
VPTPSKTNVSASPASVSPVSAQGFLTQQQFGIDIINNGAGGGITSRTSTGQFASPSSFGTITGSGPTDALPILGNFATGAGAGSSAGWQGSGVFRLKQLLSLKSRFRINSGAQIRLWFGITSGNANAANFRSDDPGNANLSNGVAVRYSTAAGDSTFQLCGFAHNSVIVPIDSHVIPDTTNLALFELDYNGVNVVFKYNGSLVAVLNSLLPVGTPPAGSNYSLAPFLCIDNVGLTNNKTFDYTSSYIVLNQA